MADESLYVTSGSVGAWTGVGSTPYLSVQDYSTNYIYSATRNSDSGTFAFADSAVGAGTISSVKLRVYCGNPSSNLTIIAVVNDGSTGTNFNLAITTTYQWVEIDVSTKLDTWTKINAANVYFDRPNSTVRTEVDAAYLYVTYIATNTKTFTADAILKKQIPKTFTTDAILKKQATKPFTVDAVLITKTTYTKTTVADAILKLVATKTFIVDASLKYINTKTTATDAILVKRLSKTATTNARLVPDHKAEWQPKWVTPVQYQMDNFETIGNWTKGSGGTMEADTTNFVEGTQSIKITSPSSATNVFMTRVITAYNFQNKYFKIWAYVDNVSNLGELRIYLSQDSGFTEYATTNLYQFVNNQPIQTGWNEFTVVFDAGTWTVTTATSQTLNQVINGVTRIRLRCTAIGASAVAVSWDDWEVIPAQVDGAVTIIFDDNNKTVIDNAYPVLLDKGFKAVVAVAPNTQVGNPTYMSLTEDGTLDTAGWDIISHGYNHVDFTTLTDEQLKTELADAKAWLTINNFSPQFVAAPFHGWNYAVANTVAMYHDMMRCRSSGSSESPIPTDPKYLKAHTITNLTTLDAAKAFVNAAKQYKVWSIITLHRIVATPTVETEWSQDNFDALVDYIDTEGVRVLTFTEKYAEITDNAWSKFITVNARLKKLNAEKTFTVDAVLGGSKTKDFTVDAILKKQTTKVFTVDAVLSKRTVKTVTTDAILVKRLTKTTLVDAVLKNRFTKPFLVDSQLKYIKDKTFSADGVIVSRKVKSVLSDAILKKIGVQKTFSADGYLVKRLTKTILADAMLESTKTKTFIADAILSGSKTKDFSIDAVLKKATTKDVIVDALLKSTKTKGVIVDAHLRWKNGFEDQLTPWIVSTDTGCTFTANTPNYVHHGVYSGKSTVAINESYAMAYKDLGKAFSTVYVRAMITFPTIPNYSGDTSILMDIGDWPLIIQGAGVSWSNPPRWAIHYNGWGTDAWEISTTDGPTIAKEYCIEIKVVIHATAGEVRLYVDGVEVLSKTGINTDGGHAGNNTDLVVGQYFYPNLADAATTVYYDCIAVDDVYIGPEVYQTKTLTSDAILKKIGVVKTTTADAILKSTTTKAFVVDGWLKKLNITKTFVVDAVLTAGAVTRTKDVVVDGIVVSRKTKGFLADAMLEQVKTKTTTTDGILVKRLTKGFLTDAMLESTKTKTFVADATLIYRKTKTIATDAQLVKRATKTFLVDAVLASTAAQYTKGFVVDAILIGERMLTLPVNAYTVTGRNGWVKVGSTPYIGASDDGNYIHDKDTDTEIGDFDFQDSGISSGSVTVVELAVRCRREGDNEKIKVYLDVGSGFVLAGTITDAPEVYGWRKIDVTTIVSDFTKVDGLKMYLEYEEV